jgi:glycosyltransferase involved in cell wall biosynthesis
MPCTHSLVSPLRLVNKTEQMLLTQCMTDYFGSHFSPKKSKTLTELLAPGTRTSPRFNRRGTEFLTITKGSAVINTVAMSQGDVVQIDTGEIVEISSQNGCRITSQIFPYHKQLSHISYSRRSDTALLERLQHKTVSIVVIARDIQHHVSHAISSCLTQTYPKLQIIVVNDNSKDATGSRAESMARFDPRVEVHHVNLGANGSRAYGLEQAEGDYCLIIDGDDWLNRDAIENLLKTAHNLKSELVLFGFDHYNDKTQEFWNHIYPSFEFETDILLPKPLYDNDARQLANLNHTIWMSFFSIKLRASARKALLNLCLYEDLLFNLSLLHDAQRPALCNLILYHYRRDRTGQSTERWWEVLPTHKQACLKTAVEHALKQFKGESSDYYLLILIYKIDQIINHELGLTQGDAERDAWRSLFMELLSLFPERLQPRLVEEGIRSVFRDAQAANR